MTLAPWYIASRRANVGNFAHPHRTASDYIKLREFEWLRIKGKGGNVVGYVRDSDDARIIAATPNVCATLLAYAEALRYPRGLTDTECRALQKQISDAVRAIAPIFEGQP